MITLVQQYFSESARRFPDKRAVACGGHEKSFLDIDSFSNGVANHLRSSGIRRAGFVPFFMQKNVGSICSILSILKSDCAYVPLDVTSPRGRILSILDSCRPEWVIVDSNSKDLFEGFIADRADKPKLLVIDEFLPSDTSEPACENLSIDIAYVLFTSGSTGVPKGVMIPHKAIIDYIDWCVDEYQLSSSDVIANHAPLYFDNSTFDLYTAFKTGAELHLVDDAVNAVIPSLIGWIRTRRISTFFCVPSVLSMLLRSRRLKPDSFPDLRHLICAGEVLPPRVLREWMIMFPHVQFTNMYGPTEITVDCSYHVIDTVPEPDQAFVPIGRARRNMELFVRVEGGELSQKPGARGELLVRGTSVGYGYLNDPERSGEAFIQNPLHDLYHDPVYRTGDLVEIDPNGDLLFLGRADDQVKYLGHRIELGEIEAALGLVDGVDEGVVVFHASDVAEECAIGALVSATGDLDIGGLAAALGASLPKYMVPSVLRFTSEPFPKTPNGKYDRKAIRTMVFGAVDRIP